MYENTHVGVLESSEEGPVLCKKKKNPRIDILECRSNSVTLPILSLSKDGSIQCPERHT